MSAHTKARHFWHSYMGSQLLTDSESDICRWSSDTAHSQMALSLHGSPPVVSPPPVSIATQQINELSRHQRGVISSNTTIHTVLAVEGCIFKCLFLCGDRQNTSSVGALAGRHPLKETCRLSKSCLFAFSWLKFTMRKVLQLYKGTTWPRGCCSYFLQRNWINRGINIPASQLTVRRCVLFTFPLVTHCVVNTVVSRDGVVAAVAVLITVVIQLCVLHWPLLRGIQSPQHMYSRVRGLNALVWDESKRSNGSETHIQL